jgi:cytochrome P450
MIVSDPVIAKHVLRTANLSFDKGVLAEILAPIMGKGLIPADYETWKTRRRALVPGFHSAWLSHMVGLFSHCTSPLIAQLEGLSASGGVINMEDAFCSLSLDIIGLSVFNYSFGSVNAQSPLIRAVYNVLREAEHRSTFYFPYWNIPFNELVVPRQQAFRADLKVINDTLDELIKLAQATQSVTDLAELEARDYANVKDPSLLRFLVDMRGESTTNAQLRDDLMTMLIAGHETTAAVLTWALFRLAQEPEYMAKVRAEVDAVLPNGIEPDYTALRKLTRVRLCVAESLRLYPEPPILIRRALEAVPLPRGLGDAAVTLPKGADVFISLYNLHRSPALWGASADAWNPDRFLTATLPPSGTPSDAAAPSWEGMSAYDPELGPQSPLYPNEVATDFAFLPFGGGARKCIGDQFAVLEATVVLARVLQRFDFAFEGSPDDVGMVTGATIHTANGLRMRVSKRPGWTAAA